MTTTESLMNKVTDYARLIYGKNYEYEVLIGEQGTQFRVQLIVGTAPKGSAKATRVDDALRSLLVILSIEARKESETLLARLKELKVAVIQDEEANKI